MIVKPAVATFLACSGPGRGCGCSAAASAGLRSSVAFSVRIGETSSPSSGPAHQNRPIRRALHPHLRSSVASVVLGFQGTPFDGRLADLTAEPAPVTEEERCEALLQKTSSAAHLSLKALPGGIRGIVADESVPEGESLIRVPLEYCTTEDVVSKGKDTIPDRLVGQEWVGCRLAASLLLRLENARRHPTGSDECAAISLWSNLLPKPAELRPSLPIHWTNLSQPSEDVSSKADTEITIEETDISSTDIYKKAVGEDEADPGPGYSILSKAVKLYGRPTADRALNVYKSRSSAPEEVGLPGERAVRTLLYDTFGCSRAEVDAAVRDVVLTRGARRGGRKARGHSAKESDDAVGQKLGYTALSRGIDLYGRGTVDRALALYGSRRSAPEEEGLPCEHAVRSFLLRRYECDRSEVEAVINDVVRARGARRGGTHTASAVKKKDVITEESKKTPTMGSVALEEATVRARAQRIEDIRAVAEIVDDSASIGFTEEAVDFALDLVKTRALRIMMPQTDDNTGEGREALILPPAFDFLNHGGEMANARYGIELSESDDDKFELVVRSTRPLVAGEEVVINYGTSASPPWRCLLNYGFVPLDLTEGADLRDTAEITIGEGDEEKVFTVRSNLVPFELVAHLASVQGTADSVELVPDLAVKVAELAVTASKKLDGLDFSEDLDCVASSLLSDLRKSQQHVLSTLENAILRYQDKGWHGWNSGEVWQFEGEDGKKEARFVIV